MPDASCIYITQGSHRMMTATIWATCAFAPVQHEEDPFSSKTWAIDPSLQAKWDNLGELLVELLLYIMYGNAKSSNGPVFSKLNR